MKKLAKSNGSGIRVDESEEATRDARPPDRIGLEPRRLGWSWRFSPLDANRRGNHQDHLQKPYLTVFPGCPK